MPVPTPEWGEEIDGKLFARTMSARRRIGLREKLNSAESGMHNALVVIAGCCNKDGDWFFSDEQADELAERRADVLMRIVDAILDVNGMRAAAVDETKKN